MLVAASKVILAALVISFISWLSSKKTGLAGFLTALPIITLLVMAFSHLQWKNTEQSIQLAKSIFVATPATLLFFVPFLFAQKFSLGFWTCYSSGLVLLSAGYVVHAYISKII